MLFNSSIFLVFILVVFSLYWLIGSQRIKLQNSFILVASYFFYGWWDWRFLGLIVLSSFIDFFVALGLKEAESGSKRKMLLGISILANIGMLMYFKYMNFFVNELSSLLDMFGVELGQLTMNIVLPVGISFYTFQTLSYTIDVYRKSIPAERNVVSFFAYVSFFPQLVAGPIERASNLLPQFSKQRSFDVERAYSGLKLFLWGLVKKVVIADACATNVDYIFSNYEALPGSTLFLGALYFTFQIYGDFSGYSDMAIGIARLFGFELMRNFNYPYFSRDIAEFWRRWHISLSSWFRDYVYIPLGGSRGGKWMSIRNTMIIFLVSGFWHGANWTYIVWGALNALLFLPLLIRGKNRSNLDTIGGSLIKHPKAYLGMFSTFLVTVFIWVFFRSASISEAFLYINRIFSVSLFSSPGNPNLPILPLVSIVLFVLIEWFGRKSETPLSLIGSWPKVIRWTFYYALILLVLFSSKEQISFIYFQF